MCYDGIVTNKYVDIPGFIGLYSIDTSGDVVSYDRTVNMPNGGVKTVKSRHVSQHKNKKGYLKVMLTNKDGVRKGYFVHRLVMMSFIGGSDLQVNHKDENKKNNSLSNLGYLNNRENQIYSIDKSKTSSSFTGVTRKNSGWQSQANGKYLGMFSTEEEASLAYQEATT
jgi:hypothetical protein